MIGHTQISFITLLTAATIAVPLGILLMRTKTISEIVVNIAAILQTIPSLASSGLMVPLSGIGRVPAIIALVICALLPVLRNTYTRVREVNLSLIKAAKDIGIKPFRRLTKVELPITMPAIIAGVRTAMVLIIGTAILTTLIGVGGPRDLILLGIDRNNASLILLDTIPAALLAIIFGLVLGFMTKLSYERLLMMLGVMVMIIILAIVVPMFAQKGDKVALAGKLGSEPSIITSMYKILTEEETRDIVEVKDSMGKTAFLFNTLRSDDINGYLEFTGTVLGELTKEPLKSKEEGKVYEQTKQSLGKRYQMTILKPVKYNNTYALTVKRDFAKQHNTRTIGDLNKVKDQLKPEFTLEFNDRPDGYKAVQRAYNLNLDNMRTMELKLRYQAINKGNINLTDVYSTNAELKQYGMVVLKDNKHVFPPYQGAPLFKENFLKKHPEIEKSLNKLENKISDEDMQMMNYEVTVKSEDPYTVARDYLKVKGLIK